MEKAAENEKTRKFAILSSSATCSQPCKTTQLTVNGRIMVDALTYTTSNSRAIALEPLEEVEERGPVQDEDEDDGSLRRRVRRGSSTRRRYSHDNNSYDPTVSEIQFREQAGSVEVGVVGGIQKTRFLPLTTEQLLLCTPIVKGFDLRSKKWLEFFVDQALEVAFRLVAKWKAVLLIDECDIVFEARDVNNVDRNGIVSIFLRTLEYYQGVLFLTTNRRGNIDPAFRSRIHVHLHYPGLDSLAELSLNGRQIKNILKTSGLLAFQDDEPLAYEHIRTVLLT
ncbi:aaa family ATPase [Grosmannia clavigera kw1407]|uniref:Aaa family ATPase n=1 Tax=Grosmannia clavigera (strain kw1407 / UAMH 11150) TaxID=655863 RepID=F0XL02_GROCL|nr:aaa family ATPase [Grosmannia clavigera kw1407]EFX01622.1 aaa family ATPase [Grosmannia clavigera kw1407]